jgi:hypothetical protein
MPRSFLRDRMQLGWHVIGLAFTACASPALAADCDVNVFNAAQTAMQRGWKFTCDPGPMGVTSNFVTYPGTAVGCVIKTPPVLTTDNISKAFFFSKNEQSTGYALRNGWVVHAYEITGLQFSKLAPNNTRVHAQLNGNKTNWTYNARLSKLTLRKSGGSCAKAIDEAF